MNLRFGGVQQLGRALMLPIAVLPIAGLLLRLGQPDLLGWAAMAAAGDAIFSKQPVDAAIVHKGRDEELGLGIFGKVRDDRRAIAELLEAFAGMRADRPGDDGKAAIRRELL